MGFYLKNLISSISVKQGYMNISVLLSCFCKTMISTYRANRPLDENKNTHLGSLIAVKICLPTKNYAKGLVDSCVAVKLKIDNCEIIICAFYDPLANSTYRSRSDRK